MRNKQIVKKNKNTYLLALSWSLIIRTIKSGESNTGWRHDPNFCRSPVNPHKLTKSRCWSTSFFSVYRRRHQQTQSKAHMATTWCGNKQRTALYKNNRKLIVSTQYHKITQTENCFKYTKIKIPGRTDQSRYKYTYLDRHLHRTYFLGP